MKSFSQFLLILLLGTFLFWGCSSESTSQKKTKDKIIFGKLELSDGWARPTSQGQTGSVYLTINNGTASVDTLIGISCDVAQKAELHKSVKNDDGTISMRPTGEQAIEDGSMLHLAPGGLHIMLMKLKRDLAVGDSLSVSLEFAQVGQKTISVPVKIQN